VAYVGRDDWILCQITSKSYGDEQSIVIVDDNFETGSLHLVSYVRPGKVFTANSSIIKSQVGRLKEQPFVNIVDAIINVLRSGIASKTISGEAVEDLGE
jgi:mRNA interferase MazF